MKVKDIMTKDVIFVSPETKINKVADKLIKHRIHGVPVVKKGRLVGIITETDFFTKDPLGIYLPSYANFIKDLKLDKKVSGDQKKKFKKIVNAVASDIMTKECITVSPNAKITELVNLFRKNELCLLPVIDENNSLAGIVALADVINLINDAQ
ncbi:CBS domain-containing protein [bacterium]|nr:CBS domain-containing protein [bacterium]